MKQIDHNDILDLTATQKTRLRVIASALGAGDIMAAREMVAKAYKDVELAERMIGLFFEKYEVDNGHNR